MARILIVEDDPLISRMYQRVFNFEGFDVEMARNGQEGIDKAKANKPTIMLLDVMMPLKTGIDVLKELKADANLKNVPVIILTNLSGMKDAETAIELGAVKFIVKSEHKPTEIVKMVREILKASTRDEIPTGDKK